jgi:hypothetical protein
MATENKTKQTTESPKAFLNSITDEQKRKDGFEILELMQETTGEEPRMWGTSIIGFGNFRYKYGSGREGDWFLTGFSPRKQNHTLYVMCGFKWQADLLKKLGKYKTGQACLYINKLEDVDRSVLKQLVRESVEHCKKAYLKT